MLTGASGENFSFRSSNSGPVPFSLDDGDLSIAGDSKVGEIPFDDVYGFLNDIDLGDEPLSIKDSKLAILDIVSSEEEKVGSRDLVSSSIGETAKFDFDVDAVSPRACPSSSFFNLFVSLFFRLLDALRPVAKTGVSFKKKNPLKAAPSDRLKKSNVNMPESIRGTQGSSLSIRSPEL